MLEPREADIPALFLFFVVLPLVSYILLGKWNEAAKKNARISMLAQLAAEESLRVEAMTTADVISMGPSQKVSFYQCARCFGPATTRCSRCKSVRYCSGKCQIIHWRQGHKQECQQWQNDHSGPIGGQASPFESIDHMPFPDSQNVLFIQSDMQQPVNQCILSELSGNPTGGDAFPILAAERNVHDKKFSNRCQRENPRDEVNEGYGIDDTSEEIPCSSNSCSDVTGRGASRRCQSGSESCIVSGEMHRRHSAIGSEHFLVQNLLEDKITTKSCKTEVEFGRDKVNAQDGEVHPINGTLDSSSSSERTAVTGGLKFKKPPYTIQPSKHLLQKSATKGIRESSCPGIERPACLDKNSDMLEVGAFTAARVQSNNGVSTTGDHRMVDARKLPRHPKRSNTGIASDNTRRHKMLFPYEELVRFFQCEVQNVYPRGLLNCGNSCYANAVLQCLTCTKPLAIYFLQRRHSTSCSAQDWCLMCELELHVSLLQESGGPLSPNKILSNMRNLGCHIGSGTQEDAHEFLRLLVTSMQSICLEHLGGEKEVDTKLQETTLIQQIFGGRLRSKVKCLRCHLESERYENIMDLTLEIHGWVESLEDALTQFTAPEDLDGENMYRCGRCSTYVQARKQLSVHEVPNILTIALKRFQTGKYGKINKYVTFPDLLDMIPFMTGTGDSPPLYMLYGVVVHLDTCNASFSGHYISYIKDLQGTWFKIDDTEVQAVPFNQVMSEGAYMLFYSRSFPRPPRSCSGKVPSTHSPSVKQIPSKAQMPSGHGQSRHETSFLPQNVHSDPRVDVSGGVNDPASAYSSVKHASRNVLPPRESFRESINMDFSDATSSDWSLFTSSDESSFTTESVSDSSIADFGDTANLDAISSIFSPFYIPERPRDSSVLRARLSSSKPHTKFFPESLHFISDSAMPIKAPANVHKGKNPGRVDIAVTEPSAPLSNCSMSVRYGSNPKGCFLQTSGGLDPQI